jgi:hypothetical protein
VNTAINVKFEASSVVTMNNAVKLNVTPYDSCKNRRFGVTYRLHRQGGEKQRAGNNVSSNYQPKHVCFFAVIYIRVSQDHRNFLNFELNFGFLSKYPASCSPLMQTTQYHYYSLFVLSFSSLQTS